MRQRIPYIHQQSAASSLDNGWHQCSCYGSEGVLSESWISRSTSPLPSRPPTDCSRYTSVSSGRNSPARCWFLSRAEQVWHLRPERIKSYIPSKRSRLQTLRAPFVRLAFRLMFPAYILLHSRPYISKASPNPLDAANLPKPTPPEIASRPAFDLTLIPTSTLPEPYLYKQRTLPRRQSPDPPLHQPRLASLHRSPTTCVKLPRWCRGRALTPALRALSPSRIEKEASRISQAIL